MGDASWAQAYAGLGLSDITYRCALQLGARRPMLGTLNSSSSRPSPGWAGFEPSSAVSGEQRQGGVDGYGSG